MSGDLLPRGWVRVPLSDVAEVRLGRQRSPDKASGDDMRPYLRAANVTWAGLSLGDVKEMNFSPREFPVYELQPGDILLSEASGSPGEVGKPAVWRGEIAGCCFQNTLIRVRSRAPSPAFLHLHFLADARLGKFATAGKGSGINHLGADKMASWPISLPPLPEQHRIVAKLEALQARSRRAREALDAVPPLLEKLRQSILAAAFRGDLTKDWRAKNPDVEPARDLLKRIRVERRKKWEEAELAKLTAKGKAPSGDAWKAKYKEPEPVDTDGLPELPGGWCWAALEQVTDGNRGIPYGIVLTGEPFAGGVPTVRCGDIRDFGIDIAALKLVRPDLAAEFDRTRLAGGEVLMAIRGTVGATAVAGAEMAGMNISREVAMIPVLAGIGADYLMYCLAAPEAEARLRGHVKGVAQSGINLSDLRTLPVPVPPEREQSALLGRLRTFLAKAEQLRASRDGGSRGLTTLDRSLLAKAFRGELVPQDPTDEPAATTLVRLRAAAPDAAPRRRAPRPAK